MTKYITNGDDTCWRDAIACVLDYPPEKIPDFAKKSENNYVGVTRKWLKEKFNKGLLHIPAGEFMETGCTRYNDPIGPAGYSIGILSLKYTEDLHAIVCFNGCAFFDNNNDKRHCEYESILGYFVIYDLGSPKPKSPKKHRRRRV